MNDTPPTIPGLACARFYDDGGNGDLNDRTAYWAYCPALPRCGERVTKPDGIIKTVAQVIYKVVPISHPDVNASILMPYVVLDPNS